MSPIGWILFVIVGIVTALNPAPHRTNEESLRGALNAITRKQRSLDLNSREFYNDLHSFKYRGDNDRQREKQREENYFDEDEEELEFLPLENGQMETVGDGYRNINEKQLERALADYIKSESIQEEPVSSPFRERERSSSIKRGGSSRNDRPNADDEELARLFLEELESGSPYRQDELDDTDYYNTLQMLHRPQQENRPYGNDALMSWGDFAEKKPLRERIRDDDQMEYSDRDLQDFFMVPMVPLERRNVNGRYPLGQNLRSYREVSKRFPVAKRSAKAVSKVSQATDPKVAQDLGTLFGTQSSEKRNHTHEHGGHDHGHDHDHTHNHEQDHAHQHESEVHGMSGHNHEVTSAAPSVTPQPRGQKENMTKATKSKERSIEVKKKSVDWSDYFGIDRRKKKSIFMAKPGSQDLDDEWFLERYYKTMSDNLKSENDRDESNKKDRLQQMDSRLKNIKDLIVEEALNSDGEDIQEIKEKMMSRLAAAYSLEKMRRALKEFRDNVIIQREDQKAVHQDILTTNHPEDATSDKSEEKRGQGIANMEGVDEGSNCPELELIEKRCRVAGLLAHDIKHVLHGPCVSAQICRSCGDQDCLSRFAVEVSKACESQEIQQSTWTRDQCFEAATLLPLNPPASAVVLCHSEGRESCLMRYFYRNRQRISYPHDLHHRIGFDNIASSQR